MSDPGLRRVDHGATGECDSTLTARNMPLRCRLLHHPTYHFVNPVMCVYVF